MTSCVLTLPCSENIFVSQESSALQYEIQLPCNKEIACKMLSFDDDPVKRFVDVIWSPPIGSNLFFEDVAPFADVAGGNHAFQPTRTRKLNLATPTNKSAHAIPRC